jgi:signal transduction histidine kinase
MIALVEAEKALSRYARAADGLLQFIPRMRTLARELEGELPPIMSSTTRAKENASADGGFLSALHPVDLAEGRERVVAPIGDRASPPGLEPPFEEFLLQGPAARVLSDLTRFRAKERLQLEAMREERRRLGRDIHDGILQALTGAAMQLDAAARLIESDPATARACVQAVCELLANEQRELRALIRTTGAEGESSVSISELAAVLETVRDRIGQQWGLRVELTIGGHGTVLRDLGDDIYSIVQEALANVARHAHASTARVSLSLLADKASVVVCDDGCGFPFHGRYELADLVSRNIGPVSLRERVAARRGSLALTSSLSGSRLEIALPFGHGRARPVGR